MPDQRRERSKIVPVLVAALVCDAAVMDRSTGKKSLVGIFDRIWVAKFPAGRFMSLYAKFGDAQGYYDLVVRYVEAKSGQVIVEASGGLEASNRLMASDVQIDFPGALPFFRPGRYEFRIFANDVYLGAAVIDVALRDELEKGDVQ